jgi:hypothetical protein
VSDLCSRDLVNLAQLNIKCSMFDLMVEHFPMFNGPGGAHWAISLLFAVITCLLLQILTISCSTIVLYTSFPISGSSDLVPVAEDPGGLHLALSWFISTKFPSLHVVVAACSPAPVVLL